MYTATISTTPGDPTILTIRLKPHGIELEVQVARSELRSALCATDTYWGISAELLSHIEAVEDAALFKYARTRASFMTLSAAEIVPFTHWMAERPKAAVH